MWACRLDLTDCGVHAPKVNGNRSDRPPGSRFNTQLGVADMANASAVAVLGKVTPIETPAGATIRMIRTETGRILVGKNDGGGELTVVVSGTGAIAMTWGEFFDAASKGVQYLNDFLHGRVSSGGGGGGNCSQTVNVGVGSGNTINGNINVNVAACGQSDD